MSYIKNMYEITAENTNKIRHALSCLNEKEKDIVVLRMGLLGNKRHTLEQTARALQDKYGKIHRERVRLIEAKAGYKISLFFEDEPKSS